MQNLLVDVRNSIQSLFTYRNISSYHTVEQNVDWS